MTAFEKFISVLVSRRFWVSVLYIVVSVGLILGVPGLANLDPDTDVEQIMPLVEALKVILLFFVPVFGGSQLVRSYTVRPAGKDDH